MKKTMLVILLASSSVFAKAHPTATTSAPKQEVFTAEDCPLRKAEKSRLLANTNPPAKTSVAAAAQAEGKKGAR